MYEDIPEAVWDGAVLYGDDFDSAAIEQWFNEEAEGYASLGACNRVSYRYGYHALNRRHGYGKLPTRIFGHVLGLGSAYGEELLPILDRIGKITILEPSRAFRSTNLQGVPIDYRCPNPSGRIDLASGSVDLVVCFGVLHHIPNVSFVIDEIGRILRPGGFLLLREPIVSMGDWRKSRPGLTKNERGIPLALLRGAADATALSIVSERLVDFAPMTRVAARFLRGEVFNHSWIVWIDEWLCRCTRWNVRYHATTNWQRMRPTSCFMVLEKKGVFSEGVEP